MANCKVTNDIGVTFNVKLYRKGDKWGLDNSLTWEENEPMLYFYDSRYIEKFKNFGGLGQPVSYYYVNTIMESDSGIQLEGGVHSWYVTHKNIRDIQVWLKSQFGEEN